MCPCGGWPWHTATNVLWLTGAVTCPEGARNSTESNRDAQQWCWRATGIQGGSSRGGTPKGGWRRRRAGGAAGSEQRSPSGSTGETPLEQRHSWSPEKGLCWDRGDGERGRNGQEGLGGTNYSPSPPLCPLVSRGKGRKCLIFFFFLTIQIYFNWQYT